MSSHASWRGIAAEELDNVPSSWTGLLRRRTRHLLGSLAAPHRRAIFWLAVAILVSNLAATAVPYLVGLGIDRGVAAVRHDDYVPIVVITVLILACAVVQAVGYRVFVAGSGKVGQEVLLELRERVFGQFQRLSLAFHERYTTGRMISRLTSDFESINDMFTLGLDTLVNAALSVVSVGVILLVLDLPLGLVCLSGFIPLFFLTRWYQRESTAAYRNTRNAIALVIVHFTESLRGIRAVHAFRRQPRNDEIFGQLSEGYRAAMTRSFQLLGIYWPGIVLVGNLTTAAVLLYGGSRVIDHQMQVGVLAAFVLYLRRFFEPLAEVSQFYDSFQAAAAGLEKLAGVLDETPGVAMPERGAVVPDEGLKGAVEFRNVRFGYRDGTDILSGFDLRRAGRSDRCPARRHRGGQEHRGAVAGPLLRPARGRGVYRRHLAQGPRRDVPSQRGRHGHPGELPLFGHGGGEHSVRVAGGHRGGDRRSRSRGWCRRGRGLTRGGLRERRGQARLPAVGRPAPARGPRPGLLADPAVLILDEASSSLDAPMERLVQSALRTVLAGRTAVIIAHRLSTVEIADRVLVVESGQIVEDGPPAQLLAEGSGHYAALYEAWRESLI